MRKYYFSLWIVRSHILISSLDRKLKKRSFSSMRWHDPFFLRKDFQTSNSSLGMIWNQKPAFFTPRWDIRLWTLIYISFLPKDRGTRSNPENLFQLTLTFLTWKQERLRIFQNAKIEWILAVCLQDSLGRRPPALWEHLSQNRYHSS